MLSRGGSRFLDQYTKQFRDGGTYKGVARRLDPARTARTRRLSIRQSNESIATCVHAPVRADCPRLGALIYHKSKNLRVVQLLPGHSKLESTVRHLGIEVDDALEFAEQTEV